MTPGRLTAAGVAASVPVTVRLTGRLLRGRRGAGRRTRRRGRGLLHHDSPEDSESRVMVAAQAAARATGGPGRATARTQS